MSGIKKDNLDIIGKKFNHLTVQSYGNRLGKYIKTLNCLCDCGNKINIRRGDVVSGQTKSCGCYQRKIISEKMIGQKFGKLLVKSLIGKKINDLNWLCLCDCGKECEATSDFLKRCKNVSCGHDWLSKEDLSGKKFNMLLVLRQEGIKIMSGGRKNRIWLCECDCGKKIKILASKLKTGHTKSCGCKKLKGYKGIAGRTWCAIKHGAIGREIDFNITIQYAWKLFKKQNKRCKLSGAIIVFPNKKSSKRTASLDRIDSNKGYVEGNVQWVHQRINFMKHAMPQKTFIKICKKVARYNENT